MLSNSTKGRGLDGVSVQKEAKSKERGGSYDETIGELKHPFLGGLCATPKESALDRAHGLGSGREGRKV